MTVIKTILKINPNAVVSVKDNDINQITWQNGTTPIPKADIEAKMAELQAKPDPEDWKSNRQAIIDKQTAKENNRTSGKAKLKAGEALTDAEISALFGD